MAGITELGAIPDTKSILQKKDIKMKYLTLLIISIILFSCLNKREGEQKPTLLSKVLTITENEDKGIKEILAFYGGTSQYSIGASASTEDGVKKFFEIELSRSTVVEKYVDRSKMTASNIACIFFNNLNDQEIEKYSEIRVVLSENGEKETYKFQTAKLKLVEQRMAVLDKTVGFIKDKNFDAILPMLNNTITNYNKEELIAKLKMVDPQFGNVTEGIRKFGFVTYKSEIGKELIHISGIIVRDKQNNEFSIDLDLNSDKNEIYALDYRL
jgi:hypothetical protein